MRTRDGESPPVSGQYRAALYMRLSKDDDGISESASISTQRKILRAYSREKGYTIAEEYIDDGWSGTSFERPNFQRMIGDIEAGKINMVITKDLSRLGRDYITAGQYTEIYFPERGIRYIAINDGYDSENQYNDIAPFKHVINEMYARDASNKIRSAFKIKMQEGSFIGNFAPYGYKKTLENKNRLTIDHEAAHVVREMFMMAADGYKPSEIAAWLNQHSIAPPALYRCSKYPHLNPGNYTKRGEWTSSTICKMLANIVYLGHTAQGKTSKPSFKSKTAVRRPPGEWYVVRDTHEPIISQDVFDLVSKRSISRRNPPKTGFINIFSGVAKCSGCGGNMSATGSRRKGSAHNLVCGRYKLYGSRECSNHFIDYEFLYRSVLSEIRGMLRLSDDEKKQTFEAVEKAKRSEKAVNTRREADDLLIKLKIRRNEIDNLIRRLYEDNVTGKLGDERFIKLSGDYETEQKEVEKKIKMLREPEEQKKDTKTSSRYLFETLDGIAYIPELTPGIVKRLMDRIEIGQGYYEQTPDGKKKRQSIKIFWRFAGGAQ